MSLHMHHTGSCDDLNDENYESGVKYLRDRVDKWNIHSNGSIWRIFDTTVLALCVATLAEADAYAATRVTPRTVHAAVPSLPWREDATVNMGLEVLDFNGGKQVQFRQDGKAIADWYPSTGTTLAGNTRGPKCLTGEDVVAWLKKL